MATQAGGSESVISISKDGEALKGIGETYSSEQFTGIGIFSLPVDILSIVNGLNPKIDLVCCSGNSNGPFGPGWLLSIVGVGGKTSIGVRRYSDRADVFILSGVDDLIAVKHEAYWARYRSRTGWGARIFRYCNALPNYWEVKTNDSLESGYRTPARITQEATTADPAAVQDPVGQHNKPIVTDDGQLIGPSPLMVGGGQSSPKQKTGRLPLNVTAPTTSTFNGG